jgi:hypothetical protein
MQQFESLRDIRQKTIIVEKNLALLKMNKSLKYFGIKIIECLFEMCSAKIKKLLLPTNSKHV